MENKNPVLIKENIILNCKSVDKHTAIQAVGDLLVNHDYVTPKYVEGMHNREDALTVYIGNMLAIPHGEYEVINEIKQSGIAIMIYPDGIDWSGEEVKVVMGIAGVGDEHMKILSQTAVLFSEIENVETIISLDNVDAVYDMLTKEYDE
ncbi:MAG: PTS sugar transporter subunit IIA [Erysipelothrix sp.]